MNKLLSGRFVFTIITAGVFFYCAVVGKLPPVDIKEIIMIVLVFYFSKGNNGPKPN